jgi:uncharacterized protein (TIGR03083 family)
MTLQAWAPALPLDRYTVELRREMVRLADISSKIALPEPVPTCPAWTLADLVSHIRQGHEWATAILTTRSTVFLAPPGLSDAPDDDRSWTEKVASGARGSAQEGSLADPQRRVHWLMEGTDRLIDALDEVGADVPIWAPRGKQTKEYWARWALFEAAVHRADLCLMAGLPFVLDTDVALICVNSFLTACADPAAEKFLSPLFSEIPRGGQTLRFQPEQAPADSHLDNFPNWLITCAPDGVQITRDAPPSDLADVTIMAAPADLLMVVKGRLRPDSPLVTVQGDRALLDLWLSRAFA